MMPRSFFRLDTRITCKMPRLSSINRRVKSGLDLSLMRTISHGGRNNLSILRPNWTGTRLLCHNYSSCSSCSSCSCCSSSCFSRYGLATKVESLGTCQETKPRNVSEGNHPYFRLGFSRGLASVTNDEKGSGKRKDGELTSDELLQKGKEFFEKERPVKGMKFLKKAAALENAKAMAAIGQVLLKQAVEEDKTSHLPDSNVLVPTFDDLGRPTGGARNSNQIKLEITRIRNKNKGKKMVDKREEAFKHLLEATKNGDQDSWVVLGNAWFENKNHQGTMKKLGFQKKDAIQFYENARKNFDTPHPDALYNLANLYYDGIYVTQNVPYALELMQESVERCNDPAAKYWVGKHLFESGTEDEEVIEQAWDLIQDAADDGHSQAMVYAAATLGEDEELYDDAKKYLEKALELDDPEALGLVADLHMKPEGSFFGNSGVDYAKALRYYEIAGAHGNADALCTAGAMHYKGLGTKRDLFQAYRCYEESASLGSMQAYRNIAYMFAKGEGPLEKDEKTAMEIMKAVDAIENPQ